MSERAKRLWQEKLDLLLVEEAKAVTADQKFNLTQGIKEARGKLAELGGEPVRTDTRVAPTRLTHAAATLFGRDDELARLDAAWDDLGTHLITLVAWGGVGKTALVAKWVARLLARDEDDFSYFDWSFYSQGTQEAGSPSSDAFVAAALTFFDAAEMAQSPTSPWDKGARLARLVASRRTLLVLDGLEPLQHPPGPLAGQLKDPAIAALLKGLAAVNPGLCLVTTRKRVADLAPFRDGAAPEWPLGRLSTDAGVEFLKSFGVHGADDELEQLARDVDGHALTLGLLGQYLSRAHGGDVRRRDRVKLEKADLRTRGGHAFKTMAAYETWLAAGGEDGERQLAVLRLLGLFDRPADAGCLAALRREPILSGLTEPLAGLDQDDWNLTVRVMKGSRNLHDIALNHLTLGRAALYREILELSRVPGTAAASAARDPASEIEQAVDGLRRAGQLQHLPLGLLSRAWLRCRSGDADGARADLDEAWEIAERGRMPLHQADVQLHRARLFGDRSALAEARRLIEKHGYGRRLGELEDADAAERW